MKKLLFIVFALIVSYIAETNAQKNRLIGTYTQDLDSQLRQQKLRSYIATLQSQISQIVGKYSDQQSLKQLSQLPTNTGIAEVDIVLKTLVTKADQLRTTRDPEKVAQIAQVIQSNLLNLKQTYPDLYQLLAQAFTKVLQELHGIRIGTVIPQGQNLTRPVGREVRQLYKLTPSNKSTEVERAARTYPGGIF